MWAKDTEGARHGSTCLQALLKQRQVDLHELEANLVYKGSSRTEKPYLGKQKDR